MKTKLIYSLIGWGALLLSSLANATPAELEAKSSYHNAVRLATDALDPAIEAVSLPMNNLASSTCQNKYGLKTYPF